MARIRSIKPEFPKDELLGQLPREIRLLYVLLWTMADDSGRFRASPAFVRAEVFPYDEDLTQHKVGEWLGALEEAGRIQLYVSEKQQYGAILRWLDHQRIEKPRASELPAPPASTPNDSSHSPKDPGSVGEASGTSSSGIGVEWKGIGEGEGRGPGKPNAATASPSARVGLVPVPVESWPEGLRWVPPIVERVFDRFPETFGTRGDFLQPTKWRSLEAEVDSWGQGLNQRFADELEAVLGEFQGYWTSRKSRRRDAWRTWLNACRRWHDRQLSGALRLQAMKQQKPQRRIA